MTIKLTIESRLKAYQINAIKTLKEKNAERYSIDYKLDLSSFKSTSGKIHHLLYWEADTLLGYAALSSFNPNELEATIIVEPEKNLYNKIITGIMTFSQQRKIKKMILIADRNDLFFKSYIKNKTGYQYEFSEYSMILVVNKFVSKPIDIVLEPAKKKDAKVISSLDENELTEQVVPIAPIDLKNTFVLRKNEQVIASIRVENEENEYGIYGFVVGVKFRGQGIGRKVISCLIQQLVEKQPEKIYLEVESRNEIAFNLYRSIGFEEQRLFDYYVYEYVK